MAHYAYLNTNNIVTMVIVGKDENDSDIDWEAYYGAKRTSYNTHGGIYYDTITGKPHLDQSKSFRKNYAGVGYMYDPIRDAFIPPKPFKSWILNEQSCLWEPPTSYPNDNNNYYWNEELLNWELVK